MNNWRGIGRYWWECFLLLLLGAGLCLIVCSRDKHP